MKRLSYKQKYELLKIGIGAIAFMATWGTIIINYLEKVGIISVC